MSKIIQVLHKSVMETQQMKQGKDVAPSDNKRMPLHTDAGAHIQKF